MGHFTAVDEVDEEHSLAIGHAGLERTSVFDRSDHRRGGGINHGARHRVAVLDVHPLGRWVIEDPIAVFVAGRDLRRDLVRLQIEHIDDPLRIVAGHKPAIRGWNDGDSVDPLHTSNVGHDLVSRLVEHLHMRTARNVDAVCVRVHGDVVPCALATQHRLLDDVITLRVKHRGCADQTRCGEERRGLTSHLAPRA